MARAANQRIGRNCPTDTHTRWLDTNGDRGSDTYRHISETYRRN
jgi:hypothetical protein